MAAAQLNRTAGAEEERPSTSAERPKPVLSAAAGDVEGVGTNGDEVTRRALLGAALGVPLSCHPELGSGSSPPPAERATSWTLKQVQGDGEDAWARALAAFRAAEAEVRRIEAATAGRSAAEEEAWLPRHDAACAAMDDALDRLMALPAPTHTALAAKLELLFAHAVEPGAVDDAVTAALLTDSRRLLLPRG
ncbi:MAG TPA: hypothetical protein VKI45_11525 [Allosphingosinicella sp.]|nr:hypothetical protein [Allosphingosinicella sp.]